MPVCWWITTKLDLVFNLLKSSPVYYLLSSYVPTLNKVYFYLLFQRHTLCIVSLIDYSLKNMPKMSKVAIKIANTRGLQITAALCALNRLVACGVTYGIVQSFTE